MGPFTIVVPTRDNPQSCEHVLLALLNQLEGSLLDLRVAFLVNDTGANEAGRLQAIVAEERFTSLKPTLFYATQSWPTVEENIRHTLGANLNAIDERFLVVGNSDLVDLAVLSGALEYMNGNKLDLMLIGVINREIYQGQPIRQFYTTPRHLNPKNLLGPDRSCGADIFLKAVTDFGAVDYLAFIGCQIYTKNFFVQLCGVQAELPEALYSIPLGCLELSTRREWAVGFYPDVVVVRIDVLQFGPNSAEQAPDWWVNRQRTERGLSNHLFLSVVTNSVRLSATAFQTLVNSQAVAIPRGRPQYILSNFLYNFVQQASDYIRFGAGNPALRYSAVELQDIVDFGRRLVDVDLGLPAERQALIGTWLQHFGMVGDYSDLNKIAELLSASDAVLKLLDMRPGMERWIAQLS